MFKQLQEPQRQNKVQQLNDSREQNAINQLLSTTHDKQSSAAKFGLLNNGIRVRDPSQMFIFGDTKWTHNSAGLLTNNKSQQAGIFSQSLSVDHNLSNKDNDNCLGTKNMFAKTENSIGFHSIQTAVAESSSTDENNTSQRPVVNYVDPSRISQQTVSIRTEPLGFLRLKPCQSSKTQNNQLANQNRVTFSLVSVRNEEGQRRSTGPANVWLDAPVQQNPSVTVSCAANSRIRNPSSGKLQQLDVANQSECVLKSKKQKISMFDRRLPWHKEVTEGSSRLHAISTAELKWARSVSRPPNKVKGLPKEGAYLRWITNRKRRLLLATQLMQMLFQPPPAIVLSEDAITHCDTVAYYASKLALGDACRLCSSAGKNLTSKSSTDQDLLKVIEGFIDRSKRLKDYVLRLEKSQSLILELMMDFQDLEKLSFVNRFAKFHAQKPPTVTGARSSSSTMRKLYLQKYVEVIPMPKMVPEGQNCIFL